MENNNKTQTELKRLLKIQISRLTAHEKNLKQAQLEYKEAYAALNERRDNINLIKERIDNVYQYSTLDSESISPEKIDRCNVYLFWLNYDLEMHEYYHTQEEGRYEEANNQYITAKSSWYKQKQKTEKLNDIYIRNDNAQRALVEEMEDESYIENGLNNYCQHYG
jgi:hypothetical protein